MQFSLGLKVVIVNGAAGCGKSTFESICADIVGKAFCESRSTIDKVKEIACECQWNGLKTDRNRKFLSDLKDLLSEYNDLPNRDVISYLHNWEREIQYYHVGNKLHIFFIDAREPEQIQRLKEELNAVTVLVRRTIAEEKPASNHADEHVLDYKYDWEIDNNGTLEDLEFQAQGFVNWLASWEVTRS